MMMKSVKEYVISKRMLYTLCFVALFFIDWTRGSQAGAIWAWTINMTGAVMAVILFSAYSPKEFLKPIYVIYSAISAIALAVSYYWWTMHQAAIFVGKLLTIVLNIWVLGIFVIKMALETAVYKTQKPHFYKTEIVAAAMLLWMLLSVNEDVWPGWYLVMFGLFYHTEFKKEDMDAIKEGMLDGIIVSFFMLQGLAFVFRPYDIVRYYGIYANCNMNALFYGIVWVAFLLRLYDVRKKKEKKWKEILCFLFAGAMAAFSLMTMCKTAWLAMFATGFVYVLMADFHGLKDKAGKFLSKMILYVAVVSISIPITFAAVRYIPPIFHHPIWYDGEYSIDRVHSFDTWDSEKYISWDCFTNTIGERIKPFIKIILGSEQAGMAKVRASSLTIGDKTYKSDTEEYEKYGSVLIRIAFWKFYLSNGTMEGHHASEGHSISGYGDYVWHTQNTFIQFWYYYGIPSAVLFAVLMVMVISISVKRVLRGHENALICLLYITFWIMYGLAECVWYPGQMILFLVFFTPKFLWDTKD